MFGIGALASRAFAQLPTSGQIIWIVSFSLGAQPAQSATAKITSKGLGAFGGIGNASFSLKGTMRAAGLIGHIDKVSASVLTTDKASTKIGALGAFSDLGRITVKASVPLGSADLLAASLKARFLVSAATGARPAISIAPRGTVLGSAATGSIDRFSPAHIVKFREFPTLTGRPGTAFPFLPATIKAQATPGARFGTPFAGGIRTTVLLSTFGTLDSLSTPGRALFRDGPRPIGVQAAELSGHRVVFREFPAFGTRASYAGQARGRLVAAMVPSVRLAAIVAGRGSLRATSALGLAATTALIENAADRDVPRVQLSATFGTVFAAHVVSRPQAAVKSGHALISRNRVSTSLIGWSLGSAFALPAAGRATFPIAIPAQGARAGLSTPGRMVGVGRLFAGARGSMSASVRLFAVGPARIGAVPFVASSITGETFAARPIPLFTVRNTIARMRLQSGSIRVRGAAHAHNRIRLVMFTGQDFSPVDVGETITYSFDFVNDLAAGDTIQSVVFTSSVAADSSGNDANAASRVTGLPGINGTIVSQKLTGFVGGVTYLLEAFATTAQGDVLSLWAHYYCDIPA